MAAQFEVEDGTGLAGANSYASVAMADQYFLDRGVTAWASIAEAQKKAVLVQATDYIDQRYGARFIGARATDTQALEWPREYAGNYADDVVPTPLQRACAEYALRANGNPLAPDPKIDAAGVPMVTTMQKAGPVEQRFATAAGSSNSASPVLLRPYPAADMYLRDLVYDGGGVIR